MNPVLEEIINNHPDYADTSNDLDPEYYTGFRVGFEEGVKFIIDNLEKQTAELTLTRGSAYLLMVGVIRNLKEHLQSKYL